MTALVERLEPVQHLLAELEVELLVLARADNAPDAWATWCDLAAALTAVRAARAAGDWPSAGKQATP